MVPGLPFTILPLSISNAILMNTTDILKDNGEFITFQYSLVKKRLFKSYFNSIKSKKVIINLPPAYVLTCK